MLQSNGIFINRGGNMRPNIKKLLSIFATLVFLSVSSSSTAQNYGYPLDQKHGSDINLKSFAFSVDLANAALDRLNHKVTYDGGYRKIAFPGGDVPDNIGVCTDLVIRAYRRLGIDLQEQVHRDMLQGFSDYPNLPL